MLFEEAVHLQARWQSEPLLQPSFTDNTLPIGFKRHTLEHCTGNIPVTLGLPAFSDVFRHIDSDLHHNIFTEGLSWDVTLPDSRPSVNENGSVRSRFMRTPCAQAPLVLT